MAETIKPKDLSPNFLKKIEDKYGPTNPDDFFSSDLDTYYKADDPSERGEGRGITHTIIRLPSFTELFKDLDQAKGNAQALSRNPELRGDIEFAQQADQIQQTFNSFRTFFRKNYPDQYSMIKAAIQEISTSGDAGGFLTKYAFGKAPNYYTKVLGYKPVNQKALRKKSKGFDYVDLYKK
jgi:hypothetical protein